MLLLAFGCPSPTAPLEDVSRAVIVVLDGARVDETVQETDASLEAPEILLPELTALVAAEGLLLTGALNTGVPVTTESHVELLSGHRQPLATFPPGTLGAWRSNTPTLFEALQGSRDLSSEQLTVLVNTVLIEEALSSRYPSASTHARPTYSMLAPGGVLMEDAALLDQVQLTLAQRDTHLLLTNLHQIDLIAHAGGDYPAAIAAVDDALVRLWDFIQSTPPYAGHTWLVVLSDHGRHRVDGWDNHGDQCNGCREIPLMVLGPELTPGLDDTPVTLSDLTVTLAGLLQTELPLAEGVPIQALLADDLPTGPRQLSASDGRQAWADDGIWLDGILRSDPAALHAEAPVLDGELLCWRELHITAALDGASPWRARCEHGTDRTPLGIDAGSAFWQPATDLDDRRRRWLLDTTNPDGVTGAAGVRPRLSVWDGAVLQTHLGPELSYPLHPALLLQGDAVLVAVGYSTDESSGRDSRALGVWVVQGDDWHPLGPLTASGAVRLEHPTLHDRHSPQLAALAWMDGGGVSVVTTRLDADGFEALDVVSTTSVYPHLPPMWTEQGVLVWAEHTARGTVAVCRDGACTDTGHVTVDSLTLDGEHVWVSALDHGVWMRHRAP
ncbi:MAG: alkaline phosphatase family protein [Myxococcota bacterium]|nr:alkaline phosphatase family protein [Myxococcota bacterium]